MEGEQHWALKFPSCWLSPKKIKKGHVRRESESHTLSTVDNTSSKTEVRGLPFRAVGI